jgi:hypothetical protein
LKRVKDLFPILISDENIEKAIDTVNRTHKGRYDRPNKVTAWVRETKEDRKKDLRGIILNGFEPKPAKHQRRYDQSAGKWRDIYEPAQWPDQYIHHMVVQALQPVMMRGMDYWCCGSIKKRGTKRGIRGIKKWMEEDKKSTKYCAELDVYHFYESLTPEAVMNRMKQLVKDGKMLDVIWRLVKNGIMIGAYFSQWFANTVLQPLDHLIREKLHVKRFVRYMDNLTLFGGNKKELHKAVREIERWMNSIGLRLKGNWQVFRTTLTKKAQKRRDALPEKKKKFRKARMVTAMGYRYKAGRTLLRKRNLLRLKRQLARTYKRIDRGEQAAFSTAAGLLSRIGQLKHCNSRCLRERLVRDGLQRYLKNIVRREMKRRKEKIYAIPV